MNEILLYTKQGCPLCEEAKIWIELLKDDYILEFREIDIQSDETLHDKYALEIPVVSVNGEELMFPQLSEVEIRQRLHD
ncbi:glutaredoxin family protein [Salimicrobium halophilum]|uniref:glutaredoxin family protein n=1 Tax=Salimicrobium halophilum TaxID=86666 RepID=UPI0015A155E4|nr:glutaredoxin family protein [Salimicrobium halophilum]